MDVANLDLHQVYTHFLLFSNYLSVFVHTWTSVLDVWLCYLFVNLFITLLSVSPCLASFLTMIVLDGHFVLDVWIV